MGGKHHVRSISLPSRSHPTTLRIEDELNRLKAMGSIITFDHMLLDICGIARDNMYEIKEHVHALQSALRRRKGDSSIEDNKERKLITELKQMGNKLGASPLLLDQHQDEEQYHHFSAVIRVLTQVNAISASILQLFFSFLSSTVSSKQTRWSVVSKLMMHKGVISCEENVNELESVDAALRRHTCDVEKLQMAHKRLVELESGIEGLENRLECVFRQLIKARTSLLNIISQ
ncbi:hypothetical protein V6Z12_A11G189500 [Gossypium hirsutum]